MIIFQHAKLEIFNSTEQISVQAEYEQLNIIEADLAIEQTHLELTKEDLMRSMERSSQLLEELKTKKLYISLNSFVANKDTK